MKKAHIKAALKEKILLLEHQQKQELIVLKNQFHDTYESLKPINFLKNTFHEVTSSPDIKNNLLNNAIGIATGFLTKKVLVGASHNPIKRILGTVLEFLIANVVSKKVGQVNHSNDTN